MEGGLAFSKAWRKALSAWSWGRLSLQATCVLPRPGRRVGKVAQDDQARHLRWVKSQLHAGWHDAREKLPELTRLYRALGVCGGLILALAVLNLRPAQRTVTTREDPPVDVTVIYQIAGIGIITRSSTLSLPSRSG